LAGAGGQNEPSRLKFGFFTLVAFSVSGLSLAYSGLLPYSSLIGLWPTSRMAGILTVGMLLSLTLVFTYAAIGAAVPQAGSDYVLASRVLGGRLAFASSWTFVVFSSLLVGFFVVTIVRDLIPFGLQMVAILGNIPGVVGAVEGLSSPSGVVIAGTALVLGFFLLSMIPPCASSWMVRIGFLLGIAAWVILFIQLAGSTQPFAQSWDKLMGANNFDDQLNFARSLAMPITRNVAPLSLAGLSAGMWVFFGAFIPVFFADQVKKPGRSLFLSSLVGILICWILFIAAAILLERLAPARWLAAVSFLHLSPAYNGLSMPWLPFYAGVVRPNLFLSGFVLLAWLFGMVNLIQIYFYFTSRIILAWAKDKIFPAIFKYEHPLFKTPVVNLLLVGALAQWGMVDAAQGGQLGGRVEYIFFSAACLLIPVLAMVSYPFLRRDWFERSARFVRLKVGPIPVVTLVGLAALAYLITVLISGVVSPLLAGIRLRAAFSLIVVFVVGLLWYGIRKRYLKQQGSELEDVFKQLPGE
jgi:amino acid transporter